MLLYELPPALAVTVWRNWPQGFSRTLNSDASLWLDALFELSWKNEKGFPLSSTRFAWRNNFSLALLGKGNFPRLPNGIHALEEDGLHEQGYPFASYARLNDVARASIYAIDQLLAIDISAPEALRDKMKIPDSVIYIVGDVIGQWYYSHSKLNTLFGGSGFPGEPPEGNCVHKSQEWLRRANKSESEPVQLLGAVLTDYMNLEHWNDPKWKSGYEKITTILRKNGLQFRLNEVIGENADATKSIAVPESTLQVSTIPSGAPLSNATILFLAANPDNSTRLALDLESREIREKIRASEFPKQLSFRTEWAIRPDDLLQYLNEYKPTVVHFSGHGSTNEEIILHDINEQPKAVSKEALKALFAAFRHCVKLLVLNSCYSRAQAEGVTEVVDCAVGMKRAIGDEAARVFAASFYRALGFGLSVKDAFEQGKAALLLQGIGEDETPDLLVRSGIDPSKVYITRA